LSDRTSELARNHAFGTEVSLMELEIEKFIDTARTDNRIVLDSFLGNKVAHQSFGTGEIIRADVRDMEDGPIFLVQFADSTKEFNLDSFREGYIERIEASDEDSRAQHSQSQSDRGRILFDTL